MILCLSDLWLPFPGGAERLMFNLARYLMECSRPVAALTGYEYPLQFDGPPVASAPIGIGPDHAAGWELVASYLDLWQPRVIITHHLYAYEFEHELVATGIPLVQVVLNTRRLPDAALAVYISSWVRDTLGDSLPQDFTIPPPAFPDVIADKRGDAIGFIKPIPHKGVELVYELARLLPHKRFLVLRGEWQTLETITTSLPNVEYMQPVEDIRDFYRECRLILVPSVQEDAGTVAQECAMNRLPCISSDAGGLPELNGGIVLPSYNPAMWLGAILALDDPDAYQMVVHRQLCHLTELDIPARMAGLARAVNAL